MRGGGGGSQLSQALNAVPVLWEPTGYRQVHTQDIDRLIHRI